MRSQVAVTGQQAQSHYAGLLAAIGGTPPDPERWIAVRDKHRARRTARRYAWLRRLNYG